MTPDGQTTGQPEQPYHDHQGSQHGKQMHSRIDAPTPHEVQRRVGVRRRGIAVNQPPYGKDNCTKNEANAAHLEIEGGAHRGPDPRTTAPPSTVMVPPLRCYCVANSFPRISGGIFVQTAVTG